MLINVGTCVDCKRILLQRTIASDSPVLLETGYGLVRRLHRCTSCDKPLCANCVMTLEPQDIVVAHEKPFEGDIFCIVCYKKYSGC